MGAFQLVSHRRLYPSTRFRVCEKTFALSIMENKFKTGIKVITSRAKKSDIETVRWQCNDTRGALVTTVNEQTLTWLMLMFIKMQCLLIWLRHIWRKLAGERMNASVWHAFFLHLQSSTFSCRMKVEGCSVWHLHYDKFSICDVTLSKLICH